MEKRGEERKQGPRGGEAKASRRKPEKEKGREDPDPTRPLSADQKDLDDSHTKREDC